MCSKFFFSRLSCGLPPTRLLGFNSFSVIFKFYFTITFTLTFSPISHLTHNSRSYRDLLPDVQAPCLAKPDGSSTNMFMTYTLFCLTKLVHTPVAKFSM